MEKNVGLVYLCIHKKLLEYAPETKKEAAVILMRNFHIPKSFVYAVLKELEMYGLVNNKNRQKMEIIDTKPLENSSKLYKQVGMF